jgi:hypothetical protein
MVYVVHVNTVQDRRPAVDTHQNSTPHGATAVSRKISWQLPTVTGDTSTIYGGREKYKHFQDLCGPASATEVHCTVGNC